MSQFIIFFSLTGDEVNIQKNCVLRPAAIGSESANVEKRKEEQISVFAFSRLWSYKNVTYNDQKFDLRSRFKA